MRQPPLIGALPRLRLLTRFPRLKIRRERRELIRLFRILSPVVSESTI